MLKRVESLLVKLKHNRPLFIALIIFKEYFYFASITDWGFLYMADSKI